MRASRLALCATMLATLSACANPADHKTAAGTPAKAPADNVILVTGATGTQGGAVARELLARGFTIRALTRSPQKPAAVALGNAGATVVQGDFDDPGSLLRAMRGVHGVFAVTAFWEHGYEREVAHGLALIAAARQSGVRHFVFSSVAGADESTGLPHFDSKYVIEKNLRDSGLTYTILRPVEFMDNWRYSRAELLAGRYTNPRDPTDTHQWIAASDIGFFAAEAFANPAAWQGRTQAIAGDQMTLAELTDVMSEVFGRPVEYLQVDWDSFEQALGEDMTTMYRWFASNGYHVDIDTLRTQYPQLTTVRRYLQELVKAGD